MSSISKVIKKIMGTLSPVILEMDEEFFIPHITDLKTKAATQKNVKLEAICDVALSILQEADTLLAPTPAQNSATSTATKTTSTTSTSGTVSTPVASQASQNN